MRSDRCRTSRDPPSLGREGRRKLTESAREFPKASARSRPEGSLAEARRDRFLPDPELALHVVRLMLDLLLLAVSSTERRDHRLPQ